MNGQMETKRCRIEEVWIRIFQSEMELTDGQSDMLLKENNGEVAFLSASLSVSVCLCIR